MTADVKRNAEDYKSAPVNVSAPSIRCWSCGAHDPATKFDIISVRGRPVLICHRPSLRESGCPKEPTDVGASTAHSNETAPPVGGQQ